VHTAITNSTGRKNRASPWQIIEKHDVKEHVCILIIKQSHDNNKVGKRKEGTHIARELTDLTQRCQVVLYMTANWLCYPYGDAGLLERVSGGMMLQAVLPLSENERVTGKVSGMHDFRQ
jgi:hypothetical protein